MDRLLSAGWLETAEERQVRHVQFLALIERRNAAADNFLKSGRTLRYSMTQQTPSEAPGALPVADQTFEAGAMNAEISREPSEAALEMDLSPQAPPPDPMFEARNFLKLLGLN
jgi:hypothetical protein